MSVRVRGQDLVNYVKVRGTDVSTSMLAPSVMHVSVVQSFGMPGIQGSVVCDGYTINVSYDRKDSSKVHVWAVQNEPETEEWGCTLL
jgi:hypothetical protein